MATSKSKEETVQTAPENSDLTSIRLFKDNDKYKDDVFVAVNGKRWQIKRGVDVMVPRYVADVLEQSMKQDAATANMIERESASFQAETTARGM